MTTRQLLNDRLYGYPGASHDQFAEHDLGATFDPVVPFHTMRIQPLIFVHRRRSLPTGLQFSDVELR